MSDLLTQLQEQQNRIAQLETDLVSLVSVFDPEIKTVGKARSWIKRFLNRDGTERFVVYQWGLDSFERGGRK